MTFLAELWLPILASAVFVFIASSILHMCIPHHRSDFGKLSDEAKLLETMRSLGIQPGEYMFPCAGSLKEAGTPEMKEKFRIGPVGLLCIAPPGGFNMGKNLAIWFAYSLLIGVVTAYIGYHALGAGAPYLSVFRITGAVAVLSYATGNIHNSIWKGVRWTTTLKFVFDGTIYGLLTAGAFGWLWPEAAA